MCAVFFMRGLLIAEKPKAMRDIRSAYNKASFDYTLEFASFCGHLMALKNPDEYDPNWGGAWKADTLPMIPDFTYKANKPGEVRDLKSKIQNGHYDFIINACDAGREGEHIFRSFYESYGFSVPVKRLWINNFTDTAIIHGLNNLLPSADFDNMSLAAKLRAELDWLVGMNFSRACSISTHSRMSIGRVQTPVLSLVVARENAIMGFKTDVFYKLSSACTSSNGGSLVVNNISAGDQKEIRYKTDSEARQVKAKLLPTGSVLDVKTEQKKQHAPALFSLAEIQKAANVALKFTPDKTLATIQSLYERGYITYPRTESKFLPVEMVPDMPRYIGALTHLPEIGGVAQSITQAQIDSVGKNKSYVDNKKVTDHHAIIPTDLKVVFDCIPKDEQDIFMLIAKQFLAIFLPPSIKATTSVIIDNANNLFSCSGAVELDAGYTVLYPKKKGADELPVITKGETIRFDAVSVKEGATKPPDRYTPATLLAAMQNAGREVGDEVQRAILRETAGLGTSATRDSILKSLITKDYMSLEKNFYRPSQMGMQMIKTVEGNDFTSPVLTAKWEEKLQLLEKGEYNGDIRSEIHTYVKTETPKLLEIKSNLSSLRFPVVGNCPKCGEPVTAMNKYYVCSKYKADDKPCSVCIPKEYKGAKISDTDIKGLLSGKPTGTKTIKKDDGKSVKAKLELNGHFYLSVASTNDGTTKSTSVCACPICKTGAVEEFDGFYACSGRVSGCLFVVKKDILGTAITKADVKKLAKDKVSDVKSFTWKSGKTGTARLAVDESGKIGFKF